MRLLLDTHVLIWWLAKRPLHDRATEAIHAATSRVWVSAASAWEMAIKAGAGKLDVPDDIADQLAHHGFQVLPVTLPHALAAGALPRLHGDPFDRMLVAQAELEGLTLVTRDPQMQRYDVPVLGA